MKKINDRYFDNTRTDSSRFTIEFSHYHIWFCNSNLEFLILQFLELLKV